MAHGLWPVARWPMAYDIDGCKKKRTAVNRHRDTSRDHVRSRDSIARAAVALTIKKIGRVGKVVFMS